MDFLTFVSIVMAVAVGFAIHHYRFHGGNANDTIESIAQAILDREHVGARARQAREEIRRAIRRGMRSMR